MILDLVAVRRSHRLDILDDLILSGQGFELTGDAALVGSDAFARDRGRYDALVKIWKREVTSQRSRTHRREQRVRFLKRTGAFIFLVSLIGCSWGLYPLTCSPTWLTNCGKCPVEATTTTTKVPASDAKQQGTKDAQ